MPESRIVRAFREGAHTPRDPVEVTIAAGGGLAIKRNPNRTQLVIQNGSGAAGAAKPHRPVASIAGGYRIEDNGKYLLRADEDGDIVTAEWYVYSAAGGSFTVTEWVLDA